MNQENKANENEEEPGSLSVVNDASEGISVTSGDALDLSEYDVVAVPIDSDRAKATLDGLAPLAATIADAAGQWNQALVKFPKGYGWGDTTLRKTPGFEGWKQAGIYKGKGYKGQAAIRQAKLQPTAFANLALQGAAIVVGQAYMTEINEQLGEIQEGIASIQRDMQLEREAKLEAQFDKLREYVSCYGEIAEDPERRQAALNGIESIEIDALSAWKFQVKSMRSLRESMDGRPMDERAVAARVGEFRQRDRGAAAAFILCAAAEQTSMQYSQDFGPDRLERERGKARKRLAEYDEVRSAVQGALRKGIKHMRGDLIAFPRATDDGYKKQNPVFDALHGVGSLLDRRTPLALYKEGRKQADSKRKNLDEAVSIKNPVKDLADAETSAIDRVDFAYNKADALLLDENGIRFLKEKGEGGKAEDK